MHGRYQNYDSAVFGDLLQQLCCRHLYRDLDGAAQIYPEQIWPGQVADALRELIGQANLARQADAAHIDAGVREQPIGRFQHCVLVWLSATTHRGNRPGERKDRLLQVLRDREADVLRFARNLSVPPASNEAECDLRPARSSRTSPAG